MNHSFVCQITLSALLATSATALACPSDLDTGFADQGMSVAPLGPDTYGGGLATIVRPNGDILVAGSVNAGGDNGHPAVLRYHGDGSLDTGFGDGGATVLNVAGNFSSIGVDADGRIVAAGSFDQDAPPYWSFLIARFDDNGILDPSYGNGGTTVTPIGPDISFARGLALLDGGKAVAVGQSVDPGNPFSYRATVVRYTSDGTLDPTFGNGGIAFLARTLGSAVATGAVALTDGSVIVSGFLDNVGDTLIARFGNDGRLVDAFARHGLRISRTKAYEEAWAIGIDGEGRLYVSGDVGSVAVPSRSNIFVRRYLPTGAPDRSYGRNGKARIYFRRRFTARGLAVGTDGVASVPAFAVSGRGPAVARLTAGGQRDRAFGDDGVLRLALGARGELQSTAIQEDGKIVVTGDRGGYPLLLRLEGGAWDGVEQCVVGCGDGVLGAGEQCDDGNAVNGDGCSAGCLLE